MERKAKTLIQVKPYIAINVSLSRMMIRDYDSVTKLVEKSISDVLKRKGIRIGSFKPSERGGGGDVDFIDKLIGLFQNREFIMAIIRSLPILRKIGKFIIRKLQDLRSWYYTRQYSETVSNQEIFITLVCELDDYESEPKYALEDVKTGLEECWKLIPSINEAIDKDFSEFSKEYNLIVKRGTSMGVGVMNFTGEDKVMLKILRKLSQMNPRYTAYGFSIVNSVIFQRKMFKMHENFLMLFWY